MLTQGDPPPAWAGDSVVYEVFPDRFASSGAERAPPGWALPAAWDDDVIRGGGGDAMRQLYGGDLPGMQSHLDHIADLGADTVYLTPFFPAESNHRYNATTFARVDPLLGGDGALALLLDALHRRGMRLVGDLTPNHCGNRHDWFLAACEDPDAPEAEFFTFHRHPGSYACWLDEPTLPKFDHRSAELRRRLYEGTDSVVAHWLRAGLDGWRVDVANMAGRQGAVELNTDVARGIRRTLQAVRPDALLVAEHAFDATGVLDGDVWHGIMAYAGFSHPLWAWLRGPDFDEEFLGMPVGVPHLPGKALAATMTAFHAAVPWRSVVHSWNALDSHDTARFRTVVGSRDAHLVGAVCCSPSPACRWCSPGTRSASRASTARPRAARSPGTAHAGTSPPTTRTARSPGCAARTRRCAEAGSAGPTCATTPSPSCASTPTSASSSRSAAPRTSTLCRRLTGQSSCSSCPAPGSGSWTGESTGRVPSLLVGIGCRVGSDKEEPCPRR
jgi:hypothetical protein